LSQPEVESNGLIVSYVLDGNGGGKPLDWGGVRHWAREQGVLWVHFNMRSTAAQEWIKHQSGLDPIVAEALLAEETRPRSLHIGDGLLVVLRGVNLNPGANPEDMVSIRLWIEQDRIISVRIRRLLSVDDMREAIDNHRGPKTAGEFIVNLCERLVTRMADVIDSIDDAVDDLQAQILTTESHQLRSIIAGLRREIIIIRRYLAPQRDAIVRLVSERVSWMKDTDRMRLREIADRMTRFVEDLDSARERAAVAQEELLGRLSEQNGEAHVFAIAGRGHLFAVGLFNRAFGYQRGWNTRRRISLGICAGYTDNCHFSNCASCGI
jgi:zinc transporter